MGKDQSIYRNACPGQGAMTLEETLVIHAAPTLASLKAANLFGYAYSEVGQLLRETEDVNRKLAKKGISVVILYAADGRALIYVVRRRDLHFILDQEETQTFLFRLGYFYMTDEEALRELSARFGSDGGFPHEIGIFLGYPLHDVECFMRDGGENAVYSGIWKCYSEPEKARDYSRKLSRCAAIYTKVYRNGRSLSDLTVASQA